MSVLDRVTNHNIALDTVRVSLVARQSRTRADDDSMSIPDQVAAMREWCDRQNVPHEVVAVYEEPDTSGRKPLAKRKGLLRAVQDVEAGRAQLILCCYYDRFVRSVSTRSEVLTRIEEHGGEVMTMDMGKTSNATPVEKFSGVVLAAASELMAEQSGEKTHVTKQRNIDNGVPPFPRITPAYVKRADGTLELHPINGPLVREACRMRAANPQASYVTIARWLNDNGLVDTDTGKPAKISVTGVTTMLKSRLMVGEIHFGKFTPNLQAGAQWAGVVTDHATFSDMHRGQAPQGRRAKSERLLARLGVLTCASCTARMSVHSTSRAGKTHHYYRCGNRLCAQPAIIAAATAEDALRDQAIEWSADDEGRASATRELEAARLDRDDTAQQLADAISTLSATGLMNEPASRTSLAKLATARDAAKTKHERLTRLVTPDMTVRTRRDWNLLTLSEQREVITAVIAVASVLPGRGSDRLQISGHFLAEQPTRSAV